MHLFWGDTYERIRANMAVIRGMAARHGRENDIGFGMRLQIVCRETEKEAWAFAHELVSHASEAQKAFVKERFATSEANRRVRELAAQGEVIERNLWTGITQVRPGAGIAVVGTPEQCADTLQDFIDLGCHSFCLSGYLHDEEAERFGKWVMPILRERNRERMLADDGDGDDSRVRRSNAPDGTLPLSSSMAAHDMETRWGSRALQGHQSSRMLGGLMSRAALPDFSARQLEAVLALVEYGSFVAAAARLRISQPALTRAVKRLESELGVRLFDRTTRRVQVTAAGREFAAVAERMLADLGITVQSVREVAEERRGWSCCRASCRWRARSCRA